MLNNNKAIIIDLVVNKRDDVAEKCKEAKNNPAKAFSTNTWKDVGFCPSPIMCSHDKTANPYPIILSLPGQEVMTPIVYEVYKQYFKDSLPLNDKTIQDICALWPAAQLEEIYRKEYEMKIIDDANALYHLLMHAVKYGIKEIQFMQKFTTEL